MRNAHPARTSNKRLVVAALATCLGLAPASLCAQGVTVSLTPSAQLVDPGSMFDLSITVTQAGSPFNGFDAVIGYDHSALTLIPLVPSSQQEGDLMTSACATRFHLFKTGADSDTITDVLLCSGVSVTGPGTIYRLRFQASNTPQETHVRFLPGLQFYDAGVNVNPDTSTDADIGIGVGLVGVGSTPAPPRLALRISPNPARPGGATFTLEADQAGVQRLTVFDLKGRVVRHFQDTMSSAGARTVAWDGHDGAGRLSPPGVYLVTLELGGRTVTGRVSLLR
jgi:hypothetical protein